MLGFVSVHDFSRAEDAAEFDRALAPAAQSPLIVSVRSISPCGNPSRRAQQLWRCSLQELGLGRGRGQEDLAQRAVVRRRPARRGGETAEIEGGGCRQDIIPADENKAFDMMAIVAEIIGTKDCGSILNYSSRGRFS